MTYKNIVFDLGNVLIRLNFPYWLAQMQEKNPAITHADFDQFLNRYNLPFSTGNLSEEEMERAYRQFLNTPDLPLWEIKTLHSALFIDGYTKSTNLLPMLAARYQLYVLSNTDPWHIETIQKIIPEYSSVFTQRVYSYDTQSLKPHPEIFTTFQTITGITFTETIYVDDLAPNIQTGKDFGLQSTLVTSEDQLYQLLCATLQP